MYTVVSAPPPRVGLFLGSSVALKVILSFDGVLKHAFKTRWAVTNDGEGLVSEIVKLNQMLKFPNNHQIKYSLYTIYSFVTNAH